MANWDNPVISNNENFKKYHILVGADVLYMQSAVKPLCRLLSEVLRDDGISLIVDPGRCNTEEFVDECTNHGWTVTERQLEYVETCVSTLKKCIILIVYRVSSASELTSHWTRNCLSDFNSTEVHNSMLAAIDSLTLNANATNIGFCQQLKPH